MVTSLLSATARRAKYLTNDAYHRAFSSTRTAVVVGATSGIGEACALRLAEQGFLVVAVGRDQPGRAESVVAALVEKSLQSPSRHGSEASDDVPKHEFYACDAFSLDNVYKTAQEIQARHPTVDALIMSQGMATTQGFTPTAEGNDQKLTLHYYSRVAFVQSLLPALKRSTMPAVVLSVLSGGVHSPYRYLKDDPSLQTNYSIKNAADAAGYYNDLGMDQLAIENPNIRFVHASPGFVNTNWGTEFHPFLRGVVRLLQRLGKKPSDCAELLLGPTVLAADAGDDLPTLPTRPDGTTSAVYIVGEMGESRSLTREHNAENRDILWRHTQDVMGKAGITNNE
ncbi:short-chain dehydrogenase [Nitzschia inconspicua]|uniref:Short-chain dehydrogenase n=1 Tax=Nitzschia inconspicua TaxID=303405 RepID=A0A9K3KMK5_9STRA|nr:short-chain dehydrogenase [Nitzschia inconspicua]